MKPTNRLQRLKPPPRGIVHRVFGGGMLGLTEAQWNFVDEAFEIDYMGKGEYELGVFPRALLDLSGSKGNEIVAQAFLVKRSDIAPNPMRNIRAKVKPPVPVEPQKFYVVCRREQYVEVEQIIRALLKDKHNANIVGDPRLHAACDPFGEWDQAIVGWFELDNGFFFFTDRAMWIRVANWFDAEVEDVVGVRSRTAR